MQIFAFMGGANLDMRDATFSGPETTIVVNAVMGGASIVVGPDVRVVMEGTGILGGYSGPSGGQAIRPDSPVLRVKGVAIMGGVSVERRDPGEDREDRELTR
jgi:hypothetical protein